MAQPITELFNGGINTARHPALLGPGELQRADDCVYRDKDPAIWRAPGRVALNASALGSPSAVKGLFHAAYEKNRTDQLLALVGTKLYSSDLKSTTSPDIDALSFTELSAPGQVAGTVSGTTTFTATSGSPFTVDVIGANVYNSGVAGIYVTAVSGSDGAGHYNVVTLSAAVSNGAATLSFDYGVVFALQDSGDETLDASQYDSAYFMWNGHDDPRRVSWRGRRSIAGTAYADILIHRPIGLDAVRTAPTIAEVIDATYAWNSVLGKGTYWFLITECFAPGGDVSAAEKDSLLKSEIVEGAYLAPDSKGNIGIPLPVTVSAVTGKGIRITFPAVTNTGVEGKLANNWNIYMYGPTTDASTPPSLAQMRRIKSVAIKQFAAGATYDITDTISGNARWQRGVASTRTTDDGQSEFSSPDNCLGEPNKTYSYAKSPSGCDAPGTTNGVEKLGGWGFTTTGIYASAAIVGIRVNVYGKADVAGNATDRAGYYLHLDTASKHSPLFTGYFGGYGDDTHGGPGDTLGVAWVVGDLSSITVTIGKTGTAHNQRFALDAVVLEVFFTGNTINLNGPAYRVVTYRDQIDLSVSEPVNLPPPVATTGCFFQGSLVLNDILDETAIRFSLPGSPEAFPKPYVMRFNANHRRDRVKYLDTLNQFLIVGLENSIERVGYLPRETDTDLAEGLSHEPITSDHGIPGPLCATKFDMPSSETMLAYASQAGMFMTNGLAPIPLTNALDWKNTVKLSALSTAILRAYPREKWLVLFYCPAGATHSYNTRMLIFSYQADKIKQDGTLSVVGPIVVSGRSAAVVNVGGTSALITGHRSLGYIYQEDRGTTVPSGYQVRLSDDTAEGNGKTTASVDVTITPIIRTRKIYGAGIERDLRETQIYLLFSSYGTTTTATGVTTAGSTTITSAAAFGSVVVGMRVRGDGLDLGTIVLAKASASSITISRAANASFAAASLTFDTGTLGVTIRGSGIGEAVVGCDTQWISTLVGDLVVCHNDNARQGIELQIEKVPLTFDGNHDTATWADLGVAMRLHQFTIMGTDGGREMNRSVA